MPSFQDSTQIYSLMKQDINYEDAKSTPENSHRKLSAQRWQNILEGWGGYLWCAKGGEEIALQLLRDTVVMKNPIRNLEIFHSLTI